jgi:hypothetical protein
VTSIPIILFEGAEDKSFLHALLVVSKLHEQFDFQKGEGGGKDGFERLLKGLVTVNSKTIIIVADNDGDPQGAFRNIQKQIAAAGFTVPNLPRETVVTAGLSPLSVLMLPWDNNPGCLETLCLSAANQKYKTQLDCADGLVKCAGADRWDLAKKSKLRMRGFLSAVCQSDPNTGLRYAWSKVGGRPGDIFPLEDVAAYNQIADYFKNLAA